MNDKSLLRQGWWRKLLVISAGARENTLEKRKAGAASRTHGFRCPYNSGRETTNDVTGDSCGGVASSVRFGGSAGKTRFFSRTSGVF